MISWAHIGLAGSFGALLVDWLVVFTLLCTSDHIQGEAQAIQDPFQRKLLPPLRRLPVKLKIPRTGFTTSCGLSLDLLSFHHTYRLNQISLFDLCNFHLSLFFQK